MELAHDRVQRGARHLEPDRGFADYPARVPEHSNDMLPLQIVQCAVEGRFQYIAPYFGQRSAYAEDDRSFNEVFELAYIARQRPTCHTKAFIVSEGIVLICLFISRAHF